MTNSPTNTYWDVNGVSLQTYAQNIETWGGDREAPPPPRGENIEIPYMQGQLYMPKRPDSRVMTLSMWVTGAMPDGTQPNATNSTNTQREQFKKNWHALRDLLWTPRRQFTLTKRFTLFGDSTVYTASAKAEFAGGLNPTMNGQEMAIFTVDLLLADPYFYGAPIHLSLDPLNPEQNFTIVGDAPTNRIIATIPGASSSLRITNESGLDGFGNLSQTFFQHNYANPIGAHAVVSVKDFTAVQTTNGVATDVSASVTHGTYTGVSTAGLGDVNWMFLEPGVQRIGVAEISVPTQGVEWTNLVTNPSMENPGIGTLQATNHCTNPSMEYMTPSGTALVRQNLFPSPQFPSDTGCMVSMDGATINYGASLAHNGSTSMQVTPTASLTSDNQGVATVWNAMPAVEALSIYQISMWVLAPIGANLWFETLQWTGATLGVDTPASNFTGTGDWQLLTGTVQVTSIFNGIGWRVFYGEGGWNSIPFYITEVLVEEAGALGVPFVPNYFDGNGAFGTPNGATYSWLGTFENSISQMNATQVLLATNLFPNPSFEFPLSSNTLTQNNCTAVQSTSSIDDPFGTGHTVQITPTSASLTTSFFGVGGDSGALRLGMLAGHTYEIQAEMKLSTPLTGTLNANALMIVVQQTLSGTTTTIGTSGADSNTIGVRRKSVVFTISSGATAAWIEFWNGGTSVNAGVQFWDHVCLVDISSGAIPGNYFDGDYQALDGTYTVWNTGIRGSTTSLRYGIAVNGTAPHVSANGAACWQGPSYAGRGSYSLAVAPYLGTGTNVSWADITSGISTLAVSTTYLIRGKVHLNYPQNGTLHANARKIVVTWSTGALTPTSETTVPNAAGDYEYSALITTPSSGTLTSIGLWNGAANTGAIPVDPYAIGAIFWDDVAVINLNAAVANPWLALTPATMPYFDGYSVNIDPDVSPQWGSLPDQSSAQLWTYMPANGGTANSACQQSRQWRSYGSFSVRVRATDPVNNNSFYYPDGPAGVPRYGMVGGGSYTALVNIYMTGPQTGSLSSLARSLVLLYQTTSGGAYTSLQVQAANVAGSSTLELSFTLPSVITDAYFRLYNGGTSSSPDVFFDAFMVIQTNGDPYLGIYFDGNTADREYVNYAWTGIPDQSTSTVSGLATVGDVDLAYQPAWL